MKGNLIKELRRLVSVMYEEGYPEIFIFSITEKNGNIEISTGDFYFNTVVLPVEYSRTYEQAKRCMALARYKCGKGIKAISGMVCDEEKECIFREGDVLRVINLNVIYEEGSSISPDLRIPVH